MIAVHGGAAFVCSPSTSQSVSKVLSPSNPTVVSAVKVLEENSIFNCGRGSNLTMEGTVECEAGYMTSTNYLFGGIGSVSRLCCPSEVARQLANYRGNKNLIRPLVLTGKGAEDWAATEGFRLCNTDELVTEHSVKDLQRVKEMLNLNAEDGFENALDSSRLDTVGAVSISQDGVAEACVSSGGILCKIPGRLAHCTIFGSGVWAEQVDDVSISISVSGCGEAIVRSDFCRSLARAVINRPEDVLPPEVVHDWFDKEFLNSSLNRSFLPEHVLAGGIMLLKEGTHSELIVFHNTPYLPVAFRNLETGKKKRILSSKDSSKNIKCDSFPIR